jgi:hypothetical protein
VANRSALSERAAHGNLNQFNSLDFIFVVRDQKVGGSNPKLTRLEVEAEVSKAYKQNEAMVERQSWKRRIQGRPTAAKDDLPHAGFSSTRRDA